MITSTQCRMGRAALGWSADVLAVRAGVSRRTITNLETGKEVLPLVRKAVHEAMTAAGVHFFGTAGAELDTAAAAAAAEAQDVRGARATPVHA